MSVNNTATTLGVAASGGDWLTARRNDMAALEQLPPAIRAALCQNATNLDATSVLAFLGSVTRQVGGSAAEIATVRKLAALEAQDIRAFSDRYQARYGRPSGHVGAGVPVLRYGLLEPKRRRREPRIRGFGLPDIAEVLVS